jgi:hypothetical protein
MSSRLLITVIDCQDAEALAGFWCAALDYKIVRRWRDSHGVEYIETGADGAPPLLFQPVPDQKTVKNRLHLDIRADGPQYDEITRLVALGARVVSDDPAEMWVVLQDPEGNEFCVLPATSD